MPVTMSIILRENSDSGRGLFATERILQGKTIFTEQPYAAVVSDAYVASTCAFCFAPDASSKCAACSSTVYCHRTCQRLDWVDHKPECETLKRVVPHQPGTTVRLVCRILQKRHRSPESYDLAISRLQNFKDRFPRDTIEQFATMSIVVAECITHSRCPTPSEMISLFCCLSINAHSITNEELVNVGVGLYRKHLAMINHSCRPNVYASFNASNVVLRTARVIDKDEELMLCYVDIEDAMVARREALRKQYLFDCFCDICEGVLNGKETDARERVHCPSKTCWSSRTTFVDVGAHVKDPRCQNCTEFSSFWPDMKKDIARGQSLYAEAFGVPDAKATELLLEAEKKLSHHYDGATDVIRVRRALQDRIIHSANPDWDLANRVCQDTLKSMSEIHGSCGITPTQTIQLLKCAKISSLVGTVVESVKWWQRAFEMTVITHGEDHQLTAEARTRFIEARAMLTQI
ncbi:hypothetical protein SmJEL517_g03835 [Synchytrium microbalum]|uniref:MYND-type domain-containing protein n=1 Tax=Synchytrium microbalum TaxID=1806994 RepID=A0A507C6J0_9FUNG|nr:uncharacterized protein SmJEL517_g03835 [Synchytrium microbalum]TPX33163.1 hypothetical protein SmJEL517_g03835 [Synchytrium microbalum]